MVITRADARGAATSRSRDSLPTAPLERARRTWKLELAPVAMGSSQSTPSAASANASPAAAAAMGAGTPGGPGPGGFQPAPCAAMREDGDGSGGDCPVPEEYRGKHGIFNVYNQRIDVGASGAPVSSAPAPAPASSASRGWFGGWFGSRAGASSADADAVAIDPRNNMPVVARQGMAPGQRRTISTDRQVSTIPKSGADGTWVYPFPQMFYNSLVRKGKAEDCTEDDMAAVVSVHNSMNEDTWRRVISWERLHQDECRNPMLLRFLGRPDDLSPLAWTRYLLTGQKPFDRHDWYVDRNGKQVRYVIDYYFNEDKAGTAGQFDLVVRPAADDASSVLDRVKMTVYVGCATVGIPCPISGNNGAIGKEAVAPNTTAPEV